MKIADRLRTLPLGRTLLVCAALCLSTACDSKDGEGDSKGDADKESGASALAKKSEKDLADMKARMEKGDDIKFACAGNMAQYKDLASSKDDGDKKAFDALAQVCYVDLPTAQIAELREKMKSGDLSSTAMVDLKTTVESDSFPKDGDAAKVAAEAKTVMEVEIPLFHLGTHLETAKKEKEEGKSVSMGCIKAKQVVDKSGTALEGDEKGKAAMAAFAETCPEKK